MIKALKNTSIMGILLLIKRKSVFYPFNLKNKTVKAPCITDNKMVEITPSDNTMSKRHI